MNTEAETALLPLDLSKLENVREENGKTIARCPACAEEGRDRTGNHLFVTPNGFGCIVNQGAEGHEHRSRISQLAGHHPSNRTRVSAKSKGIGWPTLDKAVIYQHSKHQLLEDRRYLYRRADGLEDFAVVRFRRSGNKEYRPFHALNGMWQIGDPQGLLPLYNLPNLLSRLVEPVFVAEGEKAADLVNALRILGTTSAHGAKSAQRTDWTPLKGRRVMILPDNDPAGREYARTVASTLLDLDQTADVRLVALPDLPEHGDIEQWLEKLCERGYDTKQSVAELEALVERSARFSPDEKVSSNVGSSAGEPARSGESSRKPLLVLPGGEVGIGQSADELFKTIASTRTLFFRGGVVVELVMNPEPRLEVLRPERARSVFERYGQLFAYRSGANREPVLKPTVCPEETAKALLVTDAARQHLPTISGIVNCPICCECDGVGRTIGAGFDEGTGLFITGGEVRDGVPLKEAVGDLKSLVEEFDFQTPADRSRAIASFITPGLRLGQHLKKNVPIDMAEADRSQSGKTFRQRLVAAVYGEKPTLITAKDGGVGSVDEKFDHALICGLPFIQFDNFRGAMNSTHLEAFLTSENRFSARVPHSKYVDVDPSRFFIQLSSNGIETTRDLANRSSIVRIRKRTRYSYRRFPEGDLLDYIRANQPYYLGCVFAVIREWIARGKHRTLETRHDFREWAQTLDWIVRNIFAEEPLLDGHLVAQNRVSDAALGFLRKLGLELERTRRLGQELIAGEIYELAQDSGIEIPGLRTLDPKSARQIVGRVMAKIFAEVNQVEVEGFIVIRDDRVEPREDRGCYSQKFYVFKRR